MTRQNLMITILLATAGVLATSLALLPESRTVYGDVQASNGDYVMMTGRAVENGDDSVIVLENRTGKLLTYEYRADAGGMGRLLLVNPVDLTKIGKPK